MIDLDDPLHAFAVGMVVGSVITAAGFGDLWMSVAVIVAVVVGLFVLEAWGGSE